METEGKHTISKIRRILLVFKSSKLDRYRDDGSLFARQNPNDEDVTLVYDRLKSAHNEHEQSLEQAEAIFAAHGVEVLRATQPTKADVRKVDLVVTLGGDGTFLWTARKVGNTPMLGVNTAPGASIATIVAPPWTRWEPCWTESDRARLSLRSFHESPSK